VTLTLKVREMATKEVKKAEEAVADGDRFVDFFLKVELCLAEYRDTIIKPYLIDSTVNYQ